MLQQQQRVADEVLLARSDNLLLDGERLRVRNSAEMEKIDVHLNLSRENETQPSREARAAF